MQCRVCGAPMPSGANTCRNCGNFEAPAANQQGYGSQYQQADPAAYTQQYQQPGLPPYNQQYQQAAPPSYTQQYQQASPPSYTQQYQQASPPSYTQQPGPASYQQYQQPGPASYQPVAQEPPYQHPGSAFYKRPSGKPAGRPGQPPAKKRSWGLWGSIAALVVVLGVVFSLVISSMLNPGAGTSSTANTKQAPTSAASTPVSAGSKSTATNATTPTVASTQTPSTSPSGNPVDAQASSIVTSLQTSSAIDGKTYEPPVGTTTSTFKVNDPIYVQFHLDATKFSSSAGSNYVNVRFYADSKSILPDDPLQIKQYVTVGYFEAKYYAATKAGAAEIYWCHTATCSDGKLAQVVHFTVTG